MSSARDQVTKDRPAPEQASLEDAMAELGGDMAHMKRATSWWLEAKADAFKATIRRTAFKLVLLLVFLVAGISAIVALVVIFLSGVANGLTTLVGGRIWLGNLLTVVLLLGTSVFAVNMLVRRAQAVRLRELHEKYASKQPAHADST